MRVLCKSVPHHMDKDQYQKYAASLLKSTYTAGVPAKKKNAAEEYEAVAIHVKNEQGQEV